MEITGPIRYMENGFQNVIYSRYDFYTAEQCSMFTKWVIMEIGVRLLKKSPCFHSMYSQWKLFGVFLFTVLDFYIKAVILADFHKTIKEEWTFVTEISSRLIAW